MSVVCVSSQVPALQAMVAIGSDEFAAHLTVSDRVTFAVEKMTAYIKLDKGEYRLLVLKK